MKRRIVPSLVRVGRRVLARFFKTPVSEEVDEEFAFHVGYQVSADSAVWLRVVGVVGDVHASLDEDPLPQVYRLQNQLPALFGGAGARTMTLALRTSVPPESLVAAARAALADVDPEIPMAQVRSMHEIFQRSVAQPRLTRNLLGAFGLLALLLAAVGIYGVVSYTVARRTREIGIRMALGAGRARVSALMVLEGAAPALLGAALGTAAAVAGGGWLREVLFRVSPTDVLTLVTVPALLVGVALLASWLPARRASRVPPTEALREE